MDVTIHSLAWSSGVQRYHMLLRSEISGIWIQTGLYWLFLAGGGGVSGGVVALSETLFPSKHRYPESPILLKSEIYLKL